MEYFIEVGAVLADKAFDAHNLLRKKLLEKESEIIITSEKIVKANLI